jgi:hypothetical protein
MQLHIQYLKSLEESDRVNAACLEYLRSSLIYFYPEQKDIVAAAERMALECGEPLGLPSLSWKYSGLRRVIGWQLAKRSQRFLRRARWCAEAGIDALLFTLRQWHALDVNPAPPLARFVSIRQATARYRSSSISRGKPESCAVKLISTRER